MTILITELPDMPDPGPKNIAWDLREQAIKQPLCTLYTVRSGEDNYLLLKTGRNNFLDMYNKIMYRMRYKGEGMKLVQVGDSTKHIPVHEFHLQIAKLTLTR